MNKPSRKGLCEADIQAALVFEWDEFSDESSDEECEVEKTVVLAIKLKEKLKKGEEIEINLLEDIATEERVEEYPEDSASLVVEKL